MKKSGKLKFFFGIIGVILIVAILTFFLTLSMATAHSTKATLGAQARSIGTDYSGLVVQQNVEEGQRVAEDEVLFEIDSQQLKQEISEQRVKEADLPFTLSPTSDNIELRANNSGVVSEIFFREGAYTPGGAVIASVYVVDSLFVTAHFQLSPPDYARIENEAKVDLLLPDNTKKEAKILSVNLESSEDKEKVDTVVKAEIVDADMSDFRFSVGTPVEATLHLREEAWHQHLFRFIQNLFTPRQD